MKHLFVSSFITVILILSTLFLTGCLFPDKSIKVLCDTCDMSVNGTTDCARKLLNAQRDPEYAASENMKKIVGANITISRIDKTMLALKGIVQCEYFYHENSK